MTNPYIERRFTNRHGDEFLLRTLDEDDAWSFIRMVVRNKADFEKGGLARLPHDIDKYTSWIDSVRCGIFSGTDCVGLVGVENFRGRLGIFYGVDSSFRRSGVATEAVRQMLLEYLPHDEHEYSVIHVHEKNRISARVANALGFTRNEEADYRRYESTRSFKRLSGYVTRNEDFMKLNKASNRRIKP